MLVGAIGFGGSEIGFEHTDVRTVSRLLGSALDAGLNVIDTAECYDDGEERIGASVAHRRKDYYLFTKCGHPRTMRIENWSKHMLLQTIERSLRRLRTDHVDLIQLHGCPEEVLRKGEAIEALEVARAMGYSRFIGYSGDGSAARFAVECGRFDTLQTSINIADQEAVDLTLPAARERGIGVIAKRPIANAAWRDGQKPRNPYAHVYWDRLQRLDYPFLLSGVAKGESLAMALAFTLAVPGVHTAIVGTSKPSRWEENAASLVATRIDAVAYEAIRARWHAVGAGWVGQG